MYHLFLATPEQVIFDDMVSSLIAPGSEGFLEILTDHAAIIAILKTDKLVVTDKDKKKWVWAISGGYLEVSHNEATILTDSAETAEEIDLIRAERALRKAKNRIASDDPEIDLPRAENALQRAENRMKITGKK